MAKKRKIPTVVSEIEPERREAIRAAILELGEDATVKAVRQRGGGKMATVALLLKLVRSGELDPSEPWAVAPKPRAPEPEPRSSPAPAGAAKAPPTLAGVALSAVEMAALGSAVRGAKNHEQKQAVMLELGALLAEGRIDRSTALAMQDILAEARLNQKDKREAGEDEQARAQDVLMGPDAVELVEVFERIVNGRRRRKVLDFARAEAAGDAVDFPADVRLDPEKGRARLKDLALDAFGEPIEGGAAT